MPRTAAALFALALTTLAAAALGPARLDAQEAPPAPAAAEATTAPEAAAESEDRVTFDVALESGGGRIVGSAGDFEYEEGRYLLATGGVTLTFRDLEVKADRARLDIPDRRVVAEGNVILDEGPQRLAGEVLDYDLDTRTGSMQQASAYVDPDYYFEGQTISKTGPITYSVDQGSFTACEGDSPPWSIALSSADITLEEYARIRNARLKFGPLPVLYFPYILWPATSDRSSGWLVPKPGYSSREGFQLSSAYYRTFGRSADATAFFDLSTNSYNGVGAEVRYRPSENSQGVLEAYYLFEPEEGFDDENGIRFDTTRENGDDRWKFVYYHESKNLWNGWRGVASIQQYSDFDYLNDIERRVERQTRPFIYSNAFLSRNIGPHSFNLIVDQSERISLGSQTRDTRRQLPEAEYRLRKLRIGNLPVFLDMLGSVNLFQIELEAPDVEIPDPNDPEGESIVVPGEKTSFSYERADLAPSLSISLPGTSWLSTTVDLGARVTHYTKSQARLAVGSPSDPDAPITPAGDIDEDGLADSLTRFFPSAGVEVVGPSLSRIYDLGSGPFAKLRHIVEPRLNYTYVGDFDDQDRVLGFDEVDRLQSFHFYTLSVKNKLLAKERVEGDADEADSYEIASLEVAQSFSLDDDQPAQTGFLDGEFLETDEGPIVTTLRINPSRETSVDFGFVYNTLFDELQSTSVSADAQLGRHEIDLTWIRQVDAPTGEETSSQIRFSGLLRATQALTFGAAITYSLYDDPRLVDFEQLQSQAYTVEYAGQCYAWQLGYFEDNFRAFADETLRFSLTLKNVGTFLDLRESFGGS